MNDINSFLQVSARLYKFLGEVSNSDNRTEFINNINDILDERANIIENLLSNNFKFDPLSKEHQTLLELDNGIRERLKNLLEDIKKDLKNLQNAKKNELSYINPYKSLSNLDGRYFDSKK